MNSSPSAAPRRVRASHGTSWLTRSTSSPKRGARGVEGSELPRQRELLGWEGGR